MTDPHDEVDERIEEILAQLRELSEPLSEKVVWDALRVAYAKGHQDGYEVRADTEINS